MQSKIKIGKQLQLCRETLKKGKTQVEVAADLGISRGHLIAIETNKKQPSYDLLVRLADYYGIAIDTLFGREEKTLSAAASEILQLIEEMPERGRVEVLAIARAVHSFDQEFQRTAMLSNAIVALGGAELLNWVKQELAMRTARLGSESAALTEMYSLIQAAMLAEESAEDQRE